MSEHDRHDSPPERPPPRARIKTHLARVLAAGVGASVVTVTYGCDPAPMGGWDEDYEYCENELPLDFDVRAAALRGEATWQTSGRIWLRFAADMRITEYEFDSIVALEGATLDTEGTAGRDLTAMVVPEPMVGSMAIEVAVVCDSFREVLRYRLDDPHTFPESGGRDLELVREQGDE